MSTGGIIMTCMLLFDVYVGKLMCQVETYDHQLNLFIMRDFSLRRFAANVSHVNIRPLFLMDFPGRGHPSHGRRPGDSDRRLGLGP